MTETARPALATGLYAWSAMKGSCCWLTAPVGCPASQGLAVRPRRLCPAKVSCPACDRCLPSMCAALHHAFSPEECKEQDCLICEDVSVCTECSSNFSLTSTSTCHPGGCPVGQCCGSSNSDDPCDGAHPLPTCCLPAFSARCLLRLCPLLFLLSPPFDT